MDAVGTMLERARRRIPEIMQRRHLTIGRDIDAQDERALSYGSRMSAHHRKFGGRAAADDFGSTCPDDDVFLVNHAASGTY